MKNTQEQRVEHIVNRMLADRSEDAPEDALGYARNLFRSRSAEPKRSILKSILAVLQMDLAPNRAVYGERSASGAQSRQMLFEAGEHAIDLRIAAIGDRYQVKGQVLGAGFEEGAVEITDGITPVEATISGSGTFEFSALSGGEHRLIIIGREIQIVIEKMDLK